MSDEEKKDLGDKAKETFDKAKEEAREAAQEFKEDAREATQDFKEDAREFKEGAKKTAEEFKAGLQGAGGDNKKILAGILAIIVGSLGVHKFILGYNKEGFILLGATVISYLLVCLLIGAFLVWIPPLIGLIEGIIYLTKSDEEFYNTYQVGRKPWF